MGYFSDGEKCHFDCRHILRLLDKGNHELAQIKCNHRDPLRNIQIQIQDCKQKLDNFALPLTIETHDSVHGSLLFPMSGSKPESIKEEENLSASTTEEISLRGLLNLFVLLLITHNIRFVIADWKTSKFLMFDTLA